MTFSKRLKSGPITAMTFFVGTMVAAAGGYPAQAQAKTKNKKAQAVSEVQLDERDALLAHLMRRVEKLSQRVKELESHQGTLSQDRVTPTQSRQAESKPLPPIPAQNREAPRPVPSSPQAPGQFEVDEEAVERALERALVQTGALLLPAGTIEIEPDVIYSYEENNRPNLFLQDSRQIVANEQITSRVLQTGLTLRAGLPFDSQIEIGVPYEFGFEKTASIIETSNSASGLGDISLTFTKALLREGDWLPDLTTSISWNSDTGQTSNGLIFGTGFHELAASLTAVRRVDPLAFIGAVAYSTSFEKNGIDPGDEVTLTLGTVLATSPETSLRLLLQQSFAGKTEIDGRDVLGSDQEAVILSIGGSVLLSATTLLDVSAGIGLTSDAPDYSIRVTLPIRFDFPVL